MIFTQEWLRLPCATWGEVENYRKLEETANNIAVVNDIAERVNIKPFSFYFLSPKTFFHSFPINC